MMQASRVRPMVQASPSSALQKQSTPSGAALANAIRDAAGLRLYELPFTASKINKALGLR
jgi:hypothetical protein